MFWNFGNLGWLGYLLARTFTQRSPRSAQSFATAALPRLHSLGGWGIYYRLPASGYQLRVMSFGLRVFWGLIQL
jgi:hypothetical protein